MSSGVVSVYARCHGLLLGLYSQCLSSGGSLSSVASDSSGSFCIISVYAGCVLECHVRASLSSASWAGRASSVTLLAADAVVFLETVLMGQSKAVVSLGRGAWLLMIAISLGMCLQMFSSSTLVSYWWCFCSAAGLSTSLEELSFSLSCSVGLKSSLFSQLFTFYLSLPFYELTFMCFSSNIGSFA